VPVVWALPQGRQILHAPCGRDNRNRYHPIGVWQTVAVASMLWMSKTPRIRIGWSIGMTCRLGIAKTVELWGVIIVASALTAVPIVARVASGIHGQAPASQRHYPMNGEEFEDTFKRVSNWGRWGANDEAGAANLVTAPKRKAATQLVRIGES